MAEITPTPRAGTWLESTGVGYPADTQPRAGTWLESTGVGYPADTQPRAGTWLKMDGSLAIRRGRRGFGLIRGGRR